MENSNPPRGAVDRRRKVMLPSAAAIAPIECVSDDELAGILYRASHNYDPTHRTYEALREAARRLSRA